MLEHEAKESISVADAVWGSSLRLEALGVGPECTVCGLCEALAPAVFSVTEHGSAVRPESRGLWSRFLEEIRSAEKVCPSGAIGCRWGEERSPEAMLDVVTDRSQDGRVRGEETASEAHPPLHP